MTSSDRKQATGFKLGDIGQNYRDNLGAGDMTDTGNKWANRAIGLAGDIALDPLSYVTLGAAPAAKAAAKAETILKGTAKGAGRTVAKEEVARAVAKAAAETGDEALMDVAAKVARRGTGSLTAEEAAQVGIRQGVQVGVGRMKATLPGTGAVARRAEAATAGVRESVYGGRLGSKIEQVLNSLDPQNKLSRTGLPRSEVLSPTGPMQKLILVDNSRLAAGAARSMAQAARADMNKIVETYGKDVAGSRGLWEAVQGGKAATPAIANAAADIRKLMDNARLEASRLASRELGYIDGGYLPVKFTDELSALMAEKKGTRSLAKNSFEKKRAVFVDGGTFLGTTLKGATPSEVLLHAERVVKKKLGADALDLFQTNPAKLIDRYISGLQRFATDHGLASRLGTSLDEVRGLSNSGLRPRLDNAERLEQIAQEHDVWDTLPTQGSPVRPGDSIEAVSEEHALRLDAEDLFRQADNAADAGDHPTAAVAALEASAKAELASTLPVSSEQLRAVLEDGYKVTDTTVAALRMLNGGDTGWVAETLLNLQKAGAYTDPAWLVKAFDRVTSLWKGWALLSPGFHARNYMGGIFSNALAGVDLSSYATFGTQYRAYRRGYASGGRAAAVEAVDAEYRQAFAEMQRVGLFSASSGRSFSDVAESGRQARTKVGKAAQSVQAVNYGAATAVENNLRGSLAFDRILKGASIEDAMGAVAKFHFEYGEISPFFKNYIRRAVPFATWSRFNVPLQLESIARHPGNYSRFMHFANNMEMGQEGDDPNTIGEGAPGWMASLLAIKSPFMMNGRQSFITPDLPFRDLAETFETSKLMGQLNPLAKMPLEATRGRKFFNDTPLRGDVEAPKAWWPVLAALYPLGGKMGLPKVKRDGGSFVLSAGDANKLETAMPLLGRVKRLLPSDDKSQQKAFSSWLSFAFGISTQTIVDQSESVGTASRTLGKARAERTQPIPAPTAVRSSVVKPVSVGIKPTGGNAPRNAVIANTRNAKPYGT